MKMSFDINKKHHDIITMAGLFLLGKVFVMAALLTAAYVCGKSWIEIGKGSPYYVDGAHYIFLAKYGYGSSMISDNVPGQMLYAFFPLYPLLIYLLHFAAVPAEQGAFLISNICGFLSLCYLVKITDRENRGWTALLFVFSVNAVFFTVAYTESLYMFLSVYAYYLYEYKKKRLSAGIAAGLSMAARNTGCFLIAAMLLDMVLKKRKFKEIMEIGAPAILIGGAYPVYNYFKTGDLFYFMKCQAFWNNGVSFPFKGLMDDMIRLWNGTGVDWITPLLVLVSFITAVYALVQGIRRKQPGVLVLYLFFAAAALACFYKNTGRASHVSSVFRYIYGLFPLYVLLGNARDGKCKYVFWIYGLIAGYLTAVVYFCFEMDVFLA